MIDAADNPGLSRSVDCSWLNARSIIGRNFSIVVVIPGTYQDTDFAVYGSSPKLTMARPCPSNASRIKCKKVRTSHVGPLRISLRRAQRTLHVVHQSR